MSQLTNCTKFGEALKIFNFNGFIIEVISRKPRDDILTEEDESPELCLICFDIIDDAVILRSCRHKFCRQCILQAIIDNDGETMTCPAKYIECEYHNVVTTDEIRKILGKANIQLHTLEKFERRLDSLSCQTKKTKMSSASHVKIERQSPQNTPPDGAAGLWARNNHQSFIGNETPRSTAVHEEDHTPRVWPNQVMKFETPDVAAAAGWSTITVNPNFEAQQQLVRDTRARNWQMSLPQMKDEPVSPWPGSLPSTFAAVKVEPSGLRHNYDEFICSVCEMFVFEGQGVTLRTCHHSFCKVCLIKLAMSNKNLSITCPMTAIRCEEKLLEEEILALVGPDSYGDFAAYEQSESRDLLNSTTVPHLLELENYDYVENQSVFTCAICLTDAEPGSGIMLKNCLHEYCKTCLAHHIRASDELEVPCPYVAEDGTRCEGLLQDRELRALVDERVYSAHLARSLERAEATISGSFHCKTPDCPGWAEISDLVTDFRCPVCNRVSCVKCKVIHEGKTCTEYFYDTNEDARKIRDDDLTEAQLQALITSKKAMACPGCGVVIQKNQGCNHMTCSRCKREFQWQGLA